MARGRRGQQERRQTQQAGRQGPVARYVPSPEHKTHPGAWGQPQWHRRDPPISPCPTNLPNETAPLWLAEALNHPFCWEDPDGLGGAFPPYLYWRDPDTNQFFIGQRSERDPKNAEAFTYKGYPVEDAEVPTRIADAFFEHGLIDENVRRKLKRARRARFGAKS